MNLNTNILLAKDDVGKSKTTFMAKTVPDIVYGFKPKKIPYGVKECFLISYS